MWPTNTSTALIDSCPLRGPWHPRIRLRNGNRWGRMPQTLHVRCYRGWCWLTRRARMRAPSLPARACRGQKDFNLQLKPKDQAARRRLRRDESVLCVLLEDGTARTLLGIGGRRHVLWHDGDGHSLPAHGWRVSVSKNM